MTVENNKVLYIYPSYSSFINKDIEIISSKYRVIESRNNWKNKKLTPLSLIKQFVFLALNIRKMKTVFVMFGGYWSLLPTLFGKLFKIPVYIILGGTDCVSYPSINYGSLRKPILRFFIKHSYINCTKLLPVDDSLVYSENLYWNGIDSKLQGFKYYFPNLNTEYEVIHNGYDPELYPISEKQKVEKTFLTIAVIENHTRLKLKGVDIIIKLARIFKDCTFNIIGISPEYRNLIPSKLPNLHFYPIMSHQEMKPFLDESEYYLQLSISEGFPNALCEAMLSKCIPIASNIAAIPKIIANTGFLIESSNPEFVINRMKTILTLNNEHLGLKARNHIIDNFHIDKRKNKLIKLIQN